jgi:hypothetical protein
VERERTTRAKESAPDLLVIQPLKDFTCAECQGTAEALDG